PIHSPSLCLTKTWRSELKISPPVSQLIQWKEPKKTVAVFGSSFLVLVSVATLSVISVVSYLLLTCLCVTITFRVYKSVIQAVQKSDEGHPFRSLLERDISVSSESVRLLADRALVHLNWFSSQTRRLLLVEDLVDSLKLAAVMWMMTYIGSVFNGVTVLILADIILFSAPLIYQKKRYFTSRLKDSSLVDFSANHTEAVDEHRSILEAKFNNVMTICAMLPLLLCTCLNSFLHSLISQRLRVMGSLLVIMFVFIVTAILVKVQMEPLPFFSVTMVKIIIINSFGAVLQGSLFGMAGLLPTSYTTPIMSGQGLAGTFAAFAMICAIASGSELQDAAFGYFITACVVIFLAILSYVLLPKLVFFQFYQERNRKQRSDEDNSVNLMNQNGAADPNIRQNVSMIGIFKKIWLLALSVCFTFTITIGMFPAITADTKSTIADEGSWDQYFIPVSCFLLFNLCDWGGRSLTAVCMWPQKDSLLLPVSIMCRLVFIPLFMLCNVHPRLHLPVFFHHDGWFIFFMVLFAFSNGYLASLCMCFGPKNVLPHEAETAGTIMAFFLSLGLASGAALSFIFRAMV
ncbi:Equilibrative nucleoside transporter 1, partial [Nibea albiflora]